MRPTVLLFDIDGTLVTTGGAGRRAIQRAFAEECGRDEGTLHFRLDGMTDRAIVRQALQSAGLQATEERIDHVLTRYIELLTDEVAKAHPEQYRLHPGMQAAIHHAAEAGCAVGLGTGNIRPGAKIKLERVGIYERFPFGGFGCDHESRPELIRIGAERGAQHLGIPLPECRVVVIGDTPKDVAAAHAIGAECIGVGTGSFTPAELREAGAEWAFPDLSSAEALDALLLGHPRAR